MITDDDNDGGDWGDWDDAAPKSKTESVKLPQSSKEAVPIFVDNEKSLEEEEEEEEIPKAKKKFAKKDKSKKKKKVVLSESDEEEFLWEPDVSGEILELELSQLKKAEEKSEAIMLQCSQVRTFLNVF